MTRDALGPALDGRVILDDVMERAAQRVTVLLVVLAACGGRYRDEPPARVVAPERDAAPSASHAPSRRPEAHLGPDVDAPPPGLAVRDPKAIELLAQLDPSEYARWPLGQSQHPALEPTYAIAAVFAQPGVSWLDLCRLGAQNRRGAGSRDQLEYLRAWCDVAAHDPRSAVSRLAPLMRSGVLGMPAAARADLANIVVDSGTADEAQRLLASARVDDLEIYDLVAASFAEIGRRTDALVFSERALAVNDRRRPVERCLRLTRKIVLLARGSRTSALQELARLDGNPACASLFRELACWHGRACAPYLLEHGVSHEALELGELYEGWPRPDDPPQRWIATVDRALRGPTTPSSAEATTSAMEGALRAIDCQGTLLATILNSARILKAQPHDPALDPRIDLILLTPESLCAP